MVSCFHDVCPESSTSFQKRTMWRQTLGLGKALDSGPYCKHARWPRLSWQVNFQSAQRYDMERPSFDRNRSKLSRQKQSERRSLDLPSCPYLFMNAVETLVERQCRATAGGDDPGKHPLSLRMLACASGMKWYTAKFWPSFPRFFAMSISPISPICH